MDVSEDREALTLTRERHNCPPKRWYPTTSLHGVTVQKTTTRMMTIGKGDHYQVA